jgi:mannose-6-phosphate isomerase-like protein (cupin superfamily)
MLETIRMGGLELRFLETRDSTDGCLDLFELTVQPKAKAPVPHYHESWEETLYGLSGTMTWQIDGRDATLGPGETLFIRRGVVHGFRNDGSEPAVCVCILTPGVLGAAYFREMAALLAETPPDPARLKETMLRYGLIPVPKA